MKASLLLTILPSAVAFSTNGACHHRDSKTQLFAKDQTRNVADSTKRNMLLSTGSFAAALGVGILFPNEAVAKETDCMQDCLKNCKQIAPKDPAYCADNCNSYCAQENRTDGLSGSVSSDGGEVGILGRKTVVKGEDKPPQLSVPGLDFSSDKGRKLIGY